MDFPRLVYKGPATHLSVDNVAEYNQAIKDGWYGTVPEALGQKPVYPVKPVPVPEDLGKAPVAPLTAAQVKAAKKAAARAPAVVPEPATPGRQPWE